MDGAIAYLTYVNNFEQILVTGFLRDALLYLNKYARIYTPYTHVQIACLNERHFAYTCYVHQISGHNRYIITLHYNCAINILVLDGHALPRPKTICGKS